MDLTDADVTDILALLDSLPYDELDLETSRFRLTLRRTPHGWTQSTQVLSAPAPVSPAPAAPPSRGPGSSGSMEHRTVIADSMEHRAGGDGDEAARTSLTRLEGRLLRYGRRCRGRFTGRRGQERRRSWKSAARSARTP